MKTNCLFKNLCVLAACLCLAGCEKKFGEGVTLTDIQIESESIRVLFGSSVKFHAWPVPWDCTDYEFVWESANPAVATVSPTGRISALDVGTTRMTVAQGNLKKEFTVEVYELYEETLPGKMEMLGVKGLWLFEDAGNLFGATAGNNLTPEGSGFEQTQGTNSRDKAAVLPCSEKVDNVWQHNHLICDHGFAPNGGGKYVNEFTVVVDCKFIGGPTSEGASWQDGKYYCLYQTALDNTSDGDFFWRPGADFGITGSYSKQTHLFVKDTWYRFAVVAKLGVELRYFINGQYYEANNAGDMDGDRAWRPEGVLLFADNDGENGQGFPLHVATLGIFDRALTDDEVKSLGGL
jgi:hypothetical protein